MINKLKKTRALLVLFVLLGFTCCLFAENTYALQTISTSDISLVFSKTLDYDLTEAITITDKYYIYYDVPYKTDKGCLHIISRTNNSEVKEICKDANGKRLVMHANVMAHKWGSNIVSIDDGAKRLHCLNLDKLTVTKSTSCERPLAYKLLTKLKDKRAAQDTTVYGKYYIEANGWGDNGYIAFFLKDKKSLVKEYGIPPSIVTSRCPAGSKKPEIEGISIDENSGEVHVSYTCKTSKPRKIFWFKIDNKVFNEYIKPKAAAPSDTSSDPNNNPTTNPSGDSTGNPAANPSGSNGDDSCVDTILFGSVCDNGDSNGVWKIVNIALNIFTASIALVATIGIIIVGIQYLTSRDNVQNATKAKSRLFAIVVGLVAYVALWGSFQWLLPGVLTEGEIDSIASNSANNDTDPNNVGTNPENGNSGGTNPENGGSGSVVVSSNTTTINLNSDKKTATLKATSNNTNTKSEDFTWTSSDKNVATVDKKGVVTGKGAGKVTITATLSSNKSVSGKIDITVKQKVIVIIGASQVTRFTSRCGANCADVKTYSSSSGAKYASANTVAPSYTDTLVYIDKSGSQIDYQLNKSKGWGELVKQIKGRNKDTELHIYLPIPGNEIANYECSGNAMSKKTTTNIAKYYNQLISNVDDLVKSGYKNISVKVVSVQPVRSDQTNSSSSKTVSDTHENACKTGYRSNYKYYLFNNVVSSQVSSGNKSNIQYVPLFNDIMSLSASGKKLSFRTANGWTTSTYQTVEGVHWKPSTAKKYLKAMLDLDKSL